MRKFSSPLMFSFLLAILVVLSALYGLFSTLPYPYETVNWRAQSLAQDWINLLLIAPALVATSWLAFMRSKRFLSLWAGVIGYLVYTFMIYCFAVHFNVMFPVYTTILGIAFYLLVWFFYLVVAQKVSVRYYEKSSVKVTSWFLIVLGAFFYMLWLVDIIPAVMLDKRSDVLIETGLVTNPVHVLDMAVFLPAMVITGLLLIRRHPVAMVMTPALLFFCVLMDITIGTLVGVMYSQGITPQLTVLYIMIPLLVITAGLLIRYLRRVLGGV